MWKTEGSAAPVATFIAQAGTLRYSQDCTNTMISVRTSFIGFGELRYNLLFYISGAVQWVIMLEWYPNHLIKKKTKKTTYPVKFLKYLN